MRKHSQAGCASIHVWTVENGVYAVIKDDGLGFELGEMPKELQSFGLSTMRERAESLHGTFEIKTAPGEGTEIIVFLPTLALSDEYTLI